MVALGFWYAVGAGSLLMTFAWLFVEKRITFTSLFAGIGWGWLALVGGSITKYTESGTEIPLAAPSLQYILGGLAILSFLAGVLYRFGHYPPVDDDPASIEGDHS